MTASLALAFLLSGAAALVFETLWFRQAGLMLGNSVWASSIVLGAFMSGLALGNAWAARYARSLARPLAAYAVLEAMVGASGLALVLLFPALTTAGAPLLAELVSSPPLLNAARMAVAFLLLLVPSSAMGASLPVLVRAVPAAEGHFGRTLGWLYGWNTLGAVAGSLCGDAVLVMSLGVRGAALAAAGLNLSAALLAWALSRRRGPAAAPPAGPGTPLTRRAGWLLAAAFLSGAALLGLEVVWFRFLLLFLFGSSVTFAAMLAVVLLGISLGGFLAGGWLKRRPQGTAVAGSATLLAGLAVVASYAALGGVLEPLGFRYGLVVVLPSILLVSAALMLPVSLVSGALFTLLGAALKTEMGEGSRAAGALTLANTTGAALGAMAAGLWLLPALGVERALFAFSLLYGVVALCLFASRAPALIPPRGSRLRQATWASAGLYLLFAGLFPFGLMRNHYVKGVTSRWLGPSARLEVWKEGVSETVFYIRTDAWGSPVHYRLATNGYSMSTTGVFGERYMSLFTYLATALRPDARRALLISYGVGTTAKALTLTKGLESIDVVDISRDVLELGRVVFPPGEYPLDDPRVRVHVEDGRFFLLTTPQRFDIITGEPPPPKNAGVVSLYTRDYFRLAHGRLADRGVITYWLPVYQMEPREARAITRAFCEVFADCSLWAGSGLEWLLVGSRGLKGPLTEEGLAAPFRDPDTGRALARIGLEGPEDLGALFVADADLLRAWTAADAPLDDDHPFRLSYRFSSAGQGESEYVRLMDAAATRGRFEHSRLIGDLWPAGLRHRTLDAFWVQEIANAWLLRAYAGEGRPRLPDLGVLLARTRLQAPALWLMGFSDAEVRAAGKAWAEGGRDPSLEEAQGVAAMAERDYRRAEAHLARAQPHSRRAGQILRWRVLALLLAGERAQALALLPSAAGAAGAAGDSPDARAEWTWLAQSFGLTLPAALTK